MLKKRILNPMLCSAGLLFSSFAMAAAPTSNTTTSPTMPTSTTSTSTDANKTSWGKDEWLTKLRDVVPSMICRNFTQNDAVNKQLKASSIDYDKCVSLIPASFDKCKEKYYAQLPATIDQSNASQWGRSIGECIGTDFAKTYFNSTHSDTSQSSNTSAQELTKDEWLSKLKAVVPDLICKGFLQDETLNKRLTEMNINYDKCVTLIPSSVDKCQKELYSQIPTIINQEVASKWGHSIGECIGKDFALKYLFAKKQ